MYTVMVKRPHSGVKVIIFDLHNNYDLQLLQSSALSHNITAHKFCVALICKLKYE